MVLWVLIANVFLVSGCDPSCSYCSPDACLICNDPEAEIEGQVCVTPGVTPNYPSDWGLNEDNLPTYSVTVTSDDTWNVQCSVSSETVSQEIEYMGFDSLNFWNTIAPVMWVNYDQNTEICVFYKHIQIFDVNSIIASIVADDVAFLSVNGVPSSFNSIEGQGNYNANITALFQGPGIYTVSITVNNFGGPAGVAFTFTQNINCDITCASCSNNGCDICNDPSAIVEGSVCKSTNYSQYSGNCDPSCAYCTSEVCLLCKNESDTIQGGVCVTYIGQVSSATVSTQITSDGTWDMQCTVSTETRSQVIYYYGFSQLSPPTIAPVMWSNYDQNVETCVFTKTVLVQANAVVLASMITDDTGNLYVNGSDTGVDTDDNGDGIYNYDITSFFGSTGEYQISIAVNNFLGPAGVAFVMDITINCDASCAQCNATDCLQCINPNTVISGWQCVSDLFEHLGVFEIEIISDNTWNLECSQSSETVSQVISYSGFTQLDSFTEIAPVMWANTDENTETCVFSKLIQIYPGAYVEGSMVTDNAGYVAVNGIKSNLQTFDGGQGVYHYNLTGLFTGPGIYMLSLAVQNFGGPAGVGFQLLQKARCALGCSACTSINSCDTCYAGYYLDQGNCSLCNPLCVECESLSQCSACVNNLVTNGGLCTCPNGSYLSQNTCFQCNPLCLTCSSPTTCLSCINNLVDVRGVCLCPPQTYLDRDTCLTCNSLCLECTSANNCSVCVENLVLVGGLCECPTGTYLNGNTCSQCNPLCLACSSATVCSVCVNNLVTTGGLCECATGFYLNGNTCFQCSALCIACSSATVCSLCVSNLVTTGGLCGCPSGTYLNGNTCSRCNALCTSCSSETVCSVCVNNLVTTGGLCGCPTGSYLNGNSCSQCNPLCTACSSSTVCSTCVSNLVTTGGLCGCSSGSYLSGNICLQCNPFCTTCSSATACSTCVNNLVLTGSLCGCPTGSYINGNSCSQCNSLCTACSSATVCSACVNNLDITGGLCGCITGSYLNGNSCSQCNSLCTACSSAIACSKCVNNLITTGGLCGCPSGTYLNGTSCSNCNSLCLTCNSTSNCLSCVSSATLISGSCYTCGLGTISNNVCTCIANAVKAANHTCVCNTGYTLFYGSCIQTSKLTNTLSSANISSCTFYGNSNSLSISCVFLEPYTLLKTNCSSVILNVAGFLGTSPVCIMASSTTLIIELNDATFTARPTNSIIFNATNFVRVSKALSLLSTAQVSTKLAYDTSVVPTAIINAPASIPFPCGATPSISLSGLNSQYNYGGTLNYIWATTFGSLSSITASSTTLKITAPSVSSLNVTLKVVNVLGLVSSFAIQKIAVINQKNLTVAFSYSPSVSVEVYNWLVTSVLIQNACGESGPFTYSFSGPSVYTQNPSILSQISIAPYTLTDFVDVYSIKVTVVSSNNVVGTSSLLITPIRSPPVIVLDRSSGLISNTSPFTLNLAGSFDPDLISSSLYFYASINSQPMFAVPGLQLTLPLSSFVNFSEFSLTIFAMYSPGSSLLSQVTLNLIPGTVQLGILSLQASSLLISRSEELYINSALTDLQTSLPLTYVWTSSNTGSTVLSNYPYLDKAPNTLNAGTTYIFILTVSVSDPSIPALSSSISVQVLPNTACIDSLVLTVSNEVVTFTLQGCDTPGSSTSNHHYTFGYFDNSGIKYYLTLGTGLTSIKANILPGTYTAFVTVCDLSFNNCFDQYQSFTTNAGRARLLKEKNTIEKYRQEKHLYEGCQLISEFLMQEEIDHDLLQEMWQDFTGYVNSRKINNLVMADYVVSTVTLFILSEPSPVPSEKIEKYSEIVTLKLKELDSLSDQVNESIFKQVEIIIQENDGEEYRKITNKLITLIFDFYDVARATPLKLVSDNIIVYKNINLVNYFEKQEIQIGQTRVSFANLENNLSDMIIFEEILYTIDSNSDIVAYVDIYSTEKFDGTVIKATEEKEIIFENGGIIITLNLENKMQRTCYINDKLCNVISDTGNEIILEINSSGVIRFEYSTEAATNVALSCLIMSTLALSAMLLILTIKLERNKTQFVYKEQPNADPKADIEIQKVRMQTLADEEEQHISGQSDPSSNHILYDLLLNGSALYKYKRFVVMVSVIVFEIGLQNFCEGKGFRSEYGIFEGLLSVAIFLPLNIGLMWLIRNEGKVKTVAAVLICAILQISSFGFVFDAPYYQEWKGAAITGVLAEIFVSQSFVCGIYTLYHKIS